MEFGPAFQGGEPRQTLSLCCCCLSPGGTVERSWRRLSTRTRTWGRTRFYAAWERPGSPLRMQMYEWSTLCPHVSVVPLGLHGKKKERVLRAAFSPAVNCWATIILSLRDERQQQGTGHSRQRQRTTTTAPRADALSLYRISKGIGPQVLGREAPAGGRCGRADTSPCPKALHACKQRRRGTRQPQPSPPQLQTPLVTKRQP